MTALVGATIEQVDALGALTGMLVEVERTIGQMQAVRDGILATASRLAMQVADEAGHEDFGDLTIRTVAAELGAALRVSDRTVQRRMAEASYLVERFPRVWQAQGAGRISAGHARVIVEAGEHLDDPAGRDAYSEQIIGFAETESPNRVGRMARRVAERFESRSLDDRHKDARAKRRVWVREHPDGMAELGVFGPAALIHGAFDRITAMGRALQAGPSSPGASFGPAASGASAADPEPASDTRTLDEVRCDLALDVLLTGAPAGHDTPDGLLAAITATVSVTVPALSLAGVDSTPAELNGRCPIDLSTAKALAGAASGWDRVLTHPITAGVLAVDRYRPSADLRRHLQARDQRCRFPGCGMPARDSDLDHTVDHALGGATTHANLGALCRRHHVLKHHTPWHVEHLEGGVYSWTSPTGQVYIDRPPPVNTVTFTEDPEPEPPF
ncbi:hypothetical protein RS84_01543 [Microbacterium hydrocarbonoxydans]|uniref:HNH nuclease domain-containing protein n=1 Tax=Microbacterium hydrocarbonoxydans TaxID=273678 RepID=A0A0M2HSM0_9MICO|nr:HNH endonuclease signature motif containing protein [Microbacterium hydrocarbonoxydans]KJL47915.1 hypothetical protein RS84_01543 [Microbacterium hydrocarbonoxydans]